MPTHSYTFIGTTEEVKHLLFGAPQHNDHCIAWRWHLYCQDDAKRWENVKAELRLMSAERRVREECAEAAE